MSRSERSRSPRGLALAPVAGSSPLPRSDDLDKMELAPGGQVREVYVPQPFFKVLQRGAGTGKTFESLQWLTLTDFVQFVYVVKQHSAKDVILEELRTQLKKQGIGNVIIVDDQIKECNKGYHVKLKRDDVDVQVCILTIDSLFCALQDMHFSGGDFFLKLARRIAETGASRIGEDGNVPVKGRTLKMGRGVLLVMDEAQDAECCYGDALKRVHNDWGVSVRVIGDKLQSIWFAANIFTEFLGRPGVVREDGKNWMRRFGSPKLRDFVNSMVPFQEYGCPPIELHPDVVGLPGDYEIFDAPTRRQLYENTHRMAFMDSIMERVRRECSSGRMPEDFLFIIPAMKHNPLVELLETELQLFWERKFSEEAFIAGLADDHWRGCSHEARQYVVVHHSETRGSIDLTASERATRIQTIHSAKGSGRKVVFLLGCTQHALELSAGPFLSGKQNLVFESLLHVALTRMKEQLYMSLSSNHEDEITRRLKRCGGTVDVHVTVHSLDGIHAELKSDFLARHLMDEFSKDQSVLKDSFKFQEVVDGLDQGEGPTGVVDWGHHLIRGAVMNYQALASLPHSPRSQINAIHMRMLLPKGIRTFESTARNYYDAINQMREWTSKKFERVGWPVLQFRRGKVSETFGDASSYIGRFVLKVQEKLRESTDRLPQLCPLEALTFVHMHSQVEMVPFMQFSAVEINQIFMAYLRCATLGIKFECEDCNSYWSDESTTANVAPSDAANKFSLSLCKHYQMVVRVNAGMHAYLATPGEYNITHSLKCSRLHESGPTAGLSLKHHFKPGIGYGEMTMPLVLQPALNKLNITEVYARIVAAAFIACFSNHKEPDKEERYRRKAVKTTVVSLNHRDPPVFEISPEQLASLRSPVKEWMRDYFQSKHDVFLKVYEAVFARDAGRMGGEVQENYEKIPEYLREFLRKIHEKKERKKYAKMELGSLRKQLDDALDAALEVFYEEEEELEP